MLKNKNKRAQIGQAMTWTVATIVILFILFLFVFAAGSEDILRSFSAGHGVQGKESGFAEQQTLFAILEKDDGRIRGLIEEERFDEAEVEVGLILDEFSAKGIDCKFGVIPDDKTLGFASYKFFIDNAKRGLDPES